MDRLLPGNNQRLEAARTAVVPNAYAPPINDNGGNPASTRLTLTQARVARRAGDMRGQHDIGQAQQRRVRIDRLVCENVQPRTGKVSTAKCVDERAFVNERAARGIDQPTTGAHARQRTCVDHAARLRPQRSMQADDVTLGEEFIEHTIARLEGPLDLGLGPTRLGMQNAGVEGVHPARHVLGNVPEAHQSDHFAA